MKSNAALIFVVVFWIVPQTNKRGQRGGRGKERYSGRKEN